MIHCLDHICDNRWKLKTWKGLGGEGVGERAQLESKQPITSKTTHLKAINFKVPFKGIPGGWRLLGNKGGGQKWDGCLLKKWVKYPLRAMLILFACNNI